MDLSTATGGELIALHNTLAEKTGDNDLKTWKKSKSILIGKILEMQAKVEPQPAKQPKEKKPLTRSAHRKLFNYPVQEPIKRPSRNGTKFFFLVEALLEGITRADLTLAYMKITGETFETTDEMADANRALKNSGDASHGFCTSTKYRLWKDLNNFAVRHGYGMRWTCKDEDPVFLFDSKEAAWKWDDANGREHLE